MPVGDSCQSLGLFRFLTNNPPNMDLQDRADDSSALIKTAPNEVAVKLPKRLQLVPKPKPQITVEEDEVIPAYIVH